MPFINGRYHMNPTTGHALEAAREAEAALVALQRRADGHPQLDDSDPQTSSEPSPEEAGAPIHRIEIDATEVVPNATGHATRGFVARIHRASARPPTSSGSSSASSSACAPESHVFTDHRDLLSFLQSTLAQK